jgi:hypothetical protein
VEGDGGASLFAQPQFRAPEAMHFAHLHGALPPPPYAPPTYAPPPAYAPPSYLPPPPAAPFSQGPYGGYGRGSSFQAQPGHGSPGSSGLMSPRRGDPCRPTSSVRPLRWRRTAGRRPHAKPVAPQPDGACNIASSNAL